MESPFDGSRLAAEATALLWMTTGPTPASLTK